MLCNELLSQSVLLVDKPLWLGITLKKDYGTERTPPKDKGTIKVATDVREHNRFYYISLIVVFFI